MVIYIDTGKKPTIEEIKEQMQKHYKMIEKYDLWDIFDDEICFERYLIKMQKIQLNIIYGN